MHFLRRTQALDGGDAIARMHDRQRETGVDAPAVHQHRAGAALAVVATFLGARQLQVLAQCVEQRGAGVQLQRLVFAIHVQRNGRFGRSVGTGALRACEQWRGGRRCSQFHQVAPGKFAVTGSLHVDLLQTLQLALPYSSSLTFCIQTTSCWSKRSWTAAWLIGDLGTGAVPVLDARRRPHDVTGTDRLAFAAFLLHPAAARGHDQHLSVRVRVPGGTRAGLEADDGRGEMRRPCAFEARFDHGFAGEALRRTRFRTSRSCARRRGLFASFVAAKAVNAATAMVIPATRRNARFLIGAPCRPTDHKLPAVKCRD